MVLFTHRFVLSWSISIILSFYFLHVVRGKSLGLRGDFGRSDSVPNTSLTTGVRNGTEISRRLCLTRLREALKVACGGSGRMPLYFDPNNFFNRSQTLTTISSSQSDFKNLKNDITIMSPQGQRLLRRRSRRNIVRECCHRACTPSSLKKYCSSNIRFSSNFRGESSGFSPNAVQSKITLAYKDSVSNKIRPMQDDNRYILADSIYNGTTHATPQETKGNPQTPSSQQCVTISDLQNLHKALLSKYWEKDAVASWNHIYDSPPPLGRPGLSGGDDMHSINAYAVATNEMQPKLTDLLTQIISMKERNSSPLQTLPPEPVKTTEVYESLNELEIDSTMEEELSPTSQRPSSSNIQTAKPIIFISIPKGTNDYFY